MAPVDRPLRPGKDATEFGGDDSDRDGLRGGPREPGMPHGGVPYSKAGQRYRSLKLTGDESGRRPVDKRVFKSDSRKTGDPEK